MAKRKFRKLAVLAKIEATYGTDAGPTGAADAMQMSNVRFTPLAGNEVTRDIDLPYFGNQGKILTEQFMRLEGAVEIAGAGAAGDVPAYGPLLRACAMAEAVTAGTDVTYTPVSDDPESATLYFNLDGVNHVMLGARGTMRLSMSPSAIARMEFTLTGLFGPIADTALPVTDLSAFVTPVPVGKAHTPTYQLHGHTEIAKDISIDLGNQVNSRAMINDHTIEKTGRSVSGQTRIDAGLLADYDWIGAAEARTRGALSVIHGTVAGNIFEIAAPSVEVGAPSFDNDNGIAMYSMGLDFIPVTGDDELSLIIR